MAGIQGVGNIFPAHFFGASATDFSVNVGTTTYTTATPPIFNNLTIEGTAIVRVRRHPMYIKGVLTLDDTAHLQADGVTGGNGTGTATNAFAGPALLGPNGAGGPGFNGGDGVAGGATGVTADGAAFGSPGGDGGAGGGFNGGPGGAASFAATAYGDRELVWWPDVERLRLPMFEGFDAGGLLIRNMAAGGGGGGGGAAAVGTTGGSGGSGGSLLFIFANIVHIASATAKITANGGDGGDSVGANGGGGGGGGAGCIIIVTNQLVRAAGAVVEARGGNGGAPTGAGAAGSAGLDGSVVIVTPDGVTVYSPAMP